MAPCNACHGAKEYPRHVSLRYLVTPLSRTLRKKPRIAPTLEFGILVAQVLGGCEGGRPGAWEVVTGRSLSARPFGEVAVEKVEAAAVAEFLDLAEELEFGRGGVGCPAGAHVVAERVDERKTVSRRPAQCLGLAGARSV